MNLERRYARAEVEFRAKKDKGVVGMMRGYAAKYDTLSQNLGGFVETVARGAFDKSLADGLDVLARYNHDDNMLLGRTASGSVRLWSDEVGLGYEVDLPDTQVGRDLAVLAERGDVYQSSFAFYTVSDSWGQTEQGFPLRSLQQARLVDVAPVNTPAYLDTEVGLRSFAEYRGISLDDVRAAAEANRLADLMTSAPVDDEERAAENDETETPQVDNHGLAIVRLRLAQHTLRRNP